MGKKEVIECYSIDQNGKITFPLVCWTDWAMGNALTVKEIEQLVDYEDWLLQEDWKKNFIFDIPEMKQGVHIRLGPSIIRWCKSVGIGIFLLLQLALCSEWAYAGTEFSSDGIGRASCEQWLTDRANAAKTTGYTLDVIALDHEEAWLLGYMTGNSEAYALILHKNVIESGTMGSLLGWIDSYCSENKNALLLDAASAAFSRSGLFSIN